MRLLVTGGAGFIGANFVLRAVQDRADVSVTVLDALTYAGSRESLTAVEDRINMVEGDLTDEPLVDRLVAESDAVVPLVKGGEVDAYRRGRYDLVLLGPTSFGSAWRAFRQDSGSAAAG